MNPIVKAIKAIRELGLSKLWQYALYQVGLRSGYYRWGSANQHTGLTSIPGLLPYARFPSIPDEQRTLVLEEADQIRQGKVRLFGGQPVPLNLEAGAAPQHWTILERTIPAEDIKFIWEPGRFGWAVTLARAYAFSDDLVYLEDFWQKTDFFLTAHPPNQGRQWQSAQEVAIRLMALIFCDRVFARTSTWSAQQRTRIWEAIAEHAARILLTLSYARAQNNNHLLSEAAGLYAAGLYLPDHPQAKKWRQTGWRWLNWCFLNQIDDFGTYIQHSTNYHRLMLQVALYSDHLRRDAGDRDWPQATRRRLAAAVRWLWALTDRQTGRVPNLGANDGAILFPLTVQPFEDFRPVVDAAAKAFLDQDLYQDENLSEMADWFDLAAVKAAQQGQPQAADMLRIDGDTSRAFIRAAHFRDRPSHADQLHVDLWWKHENIALDPGTFQYNALPPWDNALTTARVHNTLTVDGQDQMLRVSRFLFLDWAQATVLTSEMDTEGRVNRITAEHNGYRALGIRHQRSLSRSSNGWVIADSVLPYRKPDRLVHQVRLSWLLPDWEWTFASDAVLKLTGTDFSFLLTIEGADSLALFRAGECLSGSSPSQPTDGWFSPTYGVKQPALQLIAKRTQTLPIDLRSTFQVR